MRTANVYYNKVMAGTLSKRGSRYTFLYDQEYLAKRGSRPVSLTLPLRPEPYESEVLFPAFTNMLSEGANKRMQCRLLKIDEHDYFSLLLATAGNDGIGAITLKEKL